MQGQEERFPETKTKGRQMKEPGKSPPLTPHTPNPPQCPFILHLYTEGGCYQMGCKVSLKCCEASHSFLVVLQIRSPRLSKGKPGRDSMPLMFALWVLKSEPRARTVFISSIPGSRVESSSGHFLFSCYFHIVNSHPAERMEFL